MRTYSERPGWKPAFEVRYRFLSQAEGGRKSAPRQHIRWDFLFEGDDPLVEGVSMVWPEFVGASGDVLPEGEVPVAGKARMFIVNADRWSFHKQRVAPGVRGYFVEGAHRVAECEVTAVLALAGEHEV